MTTLDDLRRVIRTCPVIDNHAHNLLLPNKQEAYDLLSGTTEAQGTALNDTHRSLSHLRAVRQLRELYGSPETAGWEELMQKRTEILHGNFEGFLKTCFTGISCILMDDGLDDSNVYLYDWHDDFISDRTLRIVRIETVAADILREMHRKGDLPIGAAIDDDEICEQGWVLFLKAFESAIVTEIEDENVCGFKSVICYRTGLDITLSNDVQVATSGLDAFQSHYLPRCLDNDFRVESKGLNDCLVMSVCRLLTAAKEQDGIAKPLQFHTGLGDSDISLLLSDPSYLQPLIAAFPEVNIVLLHSSYPYTRQAGYLATVYKNVYLDLGEVFPQVNRNGQETILRQCMEITPLSKLLFSTDAHHFGEVYWLALKQFRKAFEKVLLEYVQNDDLSIQQAIEAAKDIYFNNSKRLYSLDVELLETGPETEPEIGPETESRTEPRTEHPETHPPNRISGLVEAPPKPLRLAWWDAEPHKEFYDSKAFTTFSNLHPDLKYVYVQWLDYMATLRTRVLPIAELRRLVTEDERISISRGNIGTLQNDHVTDAVNPVGLLNVQPDIATLRSTHSKDPLNSATVMASFFDDDGKPSLSCPRSTLQNLSDRLTNDHEISILAGFEIEVVFVKLYSSTQSYTPWTKNHAWGTFTPEQFTTALPILAEIADELDLIGIELRQFHSESGQGQYEFVLSPLPLTQAIDTLIQARQVIQQIASLHGLRATLHPKPLGNVGSGQHVHLSLNSTSLSASELEKKEFSFFAGVLRRLKSLCAVLLPSEGSYERVGEGMWTAGAWIAWGTQNREVPLRRIKKGRWELRCLDGFANPYLALSAVLAAGVLGMEQEEKMEIKDCLQNPARLSEDKRKDLNITKRIPTSLDESLSALENDDGLKKMLHEEIINDFIAMKREEKKMLEEMEEKDRHIWLIERY